MKSKQQAQAGPGAAKRARTDRETGGRQGSEALPSEAVARLFIGNQARTYKECHVWALTDEERRPWFETAEPALAALRAFSCGRFGEAWGHWWERENLPEGVLIYCTEGKGHCRHDDVQCEIGPGDLLYCPPNSHHRYWADDTKPWTILWMHLSGTQLPFYERLLGLGGSDWVRHIGVDDGIIADFTRLIVTHPPAAGTCDWFCIQAMVMAVLGRIAARPHNMIELASAYRPVQSAIALMNASLDQPFALDRYAREAGCGPRHFIRLFRQITGMPPGEWFVRQRMRRARSLLTLPNMRVKEVAARLNYPDPLYFSRVFKRVTGVSPEEFQRQMARENRRRE